MADIVVRELKQYEDERGNRIIFSGATVKDNIYIMFRGFNNTLIVDADALPRKLFLRFGSDNATLKIGNTKANVGVLLGVDSSVVIGDGLTTTHSVYITTAEGQKVSIGSDCMFAVGVQIRGDDGHPIFDIETGDRVNYPESVSIGDHVWLGYDVCVLSGSIIGDGSVIGYGSLVTGYIPNNVIAAGSPAKVIRKNIAWERPHLSLTKPNYKHHIDSLDSQKKYWNYTKFNSNE